VEVFMRALGTERKPDRGKISRHRRFDIVPLGHPDPRHPDPRRCQAPPDGLRRSAAPSVAAALLATAATALLSHSGCALSSAQEETERTVSVKPGTAVHIETRNGRVAVRAGAKGRVEVRAVKKARAMSNAKKLLEQIEVKIEPGADGLHIAAKHPSGGFQKQYGVSFEVRVPPDTPLAVKSRNGRVDLRGLGARISAETRNGSIRAAGLTVDEPVQLHSRNGSVRLEGAVQRFELTTRNGSVQVRLSGAAKLVGDSQVSTRNGSIRMWAPASFAARVDARTKNGSVRSDFSLDSPNRHRAAGTVGGGEGTLTLRARNGSIRIRRK
jgi:hypothetical protein